MKRHTVHNNGVALSVLECGNPKAARTMLCVHGLRDNAHALLPTLNPFLAEQSSASYRVFLLELRGHGQSDRSEAYGMADFILDVHQVYKQLINTPFALFGHSLGGHITAKYAALFPENVTALTLVEGMGPPQRPHVGDPKKEIAVYREMLLSRFRPSSARELPGLDEVVTKLLRNNPRLSKSAAQALAPHLTRKQDNKLVWAFDSRASSVFVGVSEKENEKFWRQIEAPTLIVSGSLAHEYWGREMNQEGFTGKFAAGEMEERISCFTKAEHHWFENSGHMVHYDEPQRLGNLYFDFLEKNYE